MNRKSILQEAFVGGMAGLAVVVCYLIARAIASDADAGDWLSFAGAMLGTMVAIAGAVFIEHLRRQSLRKDELALLRGGLVSIQSGAAILSLEPPLHLELEGQKGLYLHAIWQIQEGLEIVRFARDRSQTAILRVQLLAATRKTIDACQQIMLELNNQHELLKKYDAGKALLKEVHEALKFQCMDISYQAGRAILESRSF